MAAGFAEPAVTDNISVCSEYLCTIYTRLTIKITKKNRICRFFKKHRYLRGIFDEKRLDEIF